MFQAFSQTFSLGRYQQVGLLILLVYSSQQAQAVSILVRQKLQIFYIYLVNRVASLIVGRYLGRISLKPSLGLNLYRAKKGKTLIILDTQLLLVNLVEDSQLIQLSYRQDIQAYRYYLRIAFILLVYLLDLGCQVVNSQALIFRIQQRYFQKVETN